MLKFAPLTGTRSNVYARIELAHDGSFSKRRINERVLLNCAFANGQTNDPGCCRSARVRA